MDQRVLVVDPAGRVDATSLSVGPEPAPLHVVGNSLKVNLGFGLCGIQHGKSYVISPKGVNPMDT